MDFVDFIKGKGYDGETVWVYGLGGGGKLFIDLCLINHIEIHGIIVGDGYRENDFYQNIAVYEWSEIKKGGGKYGLLFYTVMKNINHVLPEIQSGLWQVIDFSQRQNYDKMLMMFYEYYWKEKEVLQQIERDDVWNLGGCKFLSTKPMEKEFYEAFLAEAGDMVLPPIWHDYSRVDEGDYEYGKVRLEKGDVVLDCGANIGVFSAVAAWKGAKVYAFEPLKKCFDYLKKQAEISGGERIKPVNMALSDYSGEGNIYYDESNIVEGTFESGINKRSEKICYTTVDEFVDSENLRKVDFIKADIEGAERQMLNGAAKTLARFAPKLAICTYHKPDDREVLTKIILNANPNYRIEYKWKKLYAYVPDDK